MLTAKKKIASRKVIPQSKSARLYYDLQEWFRDNMKLAGGIALGVAAVIIIGFLYVSGQAEDDLEANIQLRLVQELYQQQQFKLAITGDPTRNIPGLQEIASKYDNTPTGQIALLYLGNAYLYTGDLDNALQTFEDASPDGDLLMAATLAGQAAVYEAKQNYGEAADLFRKAAERFENELLSSERYLAAGRNYGMAGDMDMAGEMLAKVKKEKNPRYHPDADRLMAQFGITEG